MEYRGQVIRERAEWPSQVAVIPVEAADEHDALLRIGIMIGGEHTPFGTEDFNVGTGFSVEMIQPLVEGGRTELPAHVGGRPSYKGREVRNVPAYPDLEAAEGARQAEAQADLDRKGLVRPRGRRHAKRP